MKNLKKTSKKTYIKSVVSVFKHLLANFRKKKIQVFVKTVSNTNVAGNN